MVCHIWQCYTVLPVKLETATRLQFENLTILSAVKAKNSTLFAVDIQDVPLCKSAVTPGVSISPLSPTVPIFFITINAVFCQIFSGRDVEDKLRHASTLLSAPNIDWEKRVHEVTYMSSPIVENLYPTYAFSRLLIFTQKMFLLTMFANSK